MSSDLDQLLQDIDPTRNLDVVARRVDAAVSTFGVEHGVVTQWDGFKTLLARFHCHLQNKALRLDPPREPHPDFDWQACCHAFEQAWGASGSKAAFEMARAGTQGGLRKVLATVADHVAWQYATNEIRARISHFIGSLSADERLAAGKEYVAKHGHLLPSELTEGSAARILANFPRVLEEHVRLVRGLRRVGG